MKLSIKLLLTASALSILTACGNNSTTASADTTTKLASNTPAVAMSTDAYTPTAGSAMQQSAPMKVRNLSTAPAPTSVFLGAPDANKLASLKAKSATHNTSIPLQGGFARNVSLASSAALTKQLLNWQTTTSGGKVAAISINSSNAKGLRMGVVVTQLPASATLRFYAKGAATAFEAKGSEILANLAQNLSSGDITDAGRTYWSPLLEGAEATLEVELPAGVNTDAVEISIPTISHMFLSAAAASEIFASTYSYPNDGLSCEVDVTCSSPLPPASNAVALMVFQSGGETHFCSGTLVNDSTLSNTPNFISANHCISTQTVASSLTTYWFYRSASCNATNGNLFLGTTSATLLFTSLSTDGTLLRLNQTPPVGVMYAGWDSTPPALSTAVGGIHHPQVDAQRFSNGSVLSYKVFTSRDENGYTTAPSNLANSTLLNTNLLTESGSSGSAIFKNVTGSNPQVIGQLLGGTQAVCGSAYSSDYGRFDVSFNQGMSDWLNPTGNKPVARFFNTNSGTHFYSISATEGTYLKTNFSTVFSYEGTPFKASVVAGSGLSPVHRFYNLNLGVHFYTISEPERAWVVANLPQMRYEGIAWYANPTTVSGTIPLFRFYNTQKGVHFFTVSTAERDSVLANLPQMSYEGIAYYVLP